VLPRTWSAASDDDAARRGSAGQATTTAKWVLLSGSRSRASSVSCPLTPLLVAAAAAAAAARLIAKANISRLLSATVGKQGVFARLVRRKMGVTQEHALNMPFSLASRALLGGPFSMHSENKMATMNRESRTFVLLAIF
jgi:hypothetical protein